MTTEYRPGTYVYNDRSLVARGVCGWEDCALTVLATVVSVPAANRAIIDAGSKTLTSDLLGLTGYGHVLGRPDIAIDQLSEEHGRLVSEGPIGLIVSETVRVVPNHACVVTNMVDEVHVVEGGRLTGTWRGAARGNITLIGLATTGKPRPATRAAPFSNSSARLRSTAPPKLRRSARAGPRRRSRPH